MRIQTFDIDGVILINKDILGIRPYMNDIILTGRSYEEREETIAMLDEKGIYNQVIFNPLRYEEKTRISSGQHKGRSLSALLSKGYHIVAHYEDDEIQIAEIQKFVDIPIIHINHNLTYKENRRHT